MTPEQNKIASQIWGAGYTAKALIVGTILFLVTVVTHNALFGLFGSLIINTCFDVWGFALTAKRDADVSLLRGYYRVDQGIVQGLTALFVGALCGGVVFSGVHISLSGIGIDRFYPIALLHHATAFLAPLLAWQFYIQDKLFFVFQKLPNEGDYWWLRNWGVLKVFGSLSPVTNKKLNTLCLVGLALSIILLVL